MPLKVLWEAMGTIDPDTGKYRGYLLLERTHSESLIWTIEDVKYLEWKELAAWLEEVTALLKAKVSRRG